MKERTEQISRDYKILKKTKCKGGQPALLTVRVLGKAPEASSEQERRQGGEGHKTKLQ
jgi:dynein assembly factor 2